MTEELEKEATEYAQKLGVKDFIAKPKEIVAYFGYLAGAEPREKQIEIDAEQIRALQKQNGALTDKIRELEEKLKKETAQRIYNFNKSIEWKEKHRELEAQIEKMKCCFNCKHSRTEYEHCKTDKHEKWEIKND